MSTPDRYREDADPRLADDPPTWADAEGLDLSPRNVKRTPYPGPCALCHSWTPNLCNHPTDITPAMQYGPTVKLPDYYDHREQADVDAEDARREER